MAMNPVMPSSRGPSGEATSSSAWTANQVTHRGGEGDARAGRHRLAAGLVDAHHAGRHGGEDQHRLQALAEDDHRRVEDDRAVALAGADVGRVRAAGVGRGHQVDEAGDDQQAGRPPGEACPRSAHLGTLTTADEKCRDEDRRLRRRAHRRRRGRRRAAARPAATSRSPTARSATRSATTGRGPPRPPPATSPTAAPTRASCAAGPAPARRSPPTRSTASAPRCAATPPPPRAPASGTTPTCSRCRLRTTSAALLEEILDAWFAAAPSPDAGDARQRRPPRPTSDAMRSARRIRGCSAWASAR